jgi:hypothetical protein
LGDPRSLEFKSGFVKHCQNLKYPKAVLETLDKEGLLAPLLADLVNFKLHDPSEDRRVRLTNDNGKFTTYFKLPTFENNPHLREKIKKLIGDTPILIIGAGPAGIMQAEALIGLGVPSKNIKLIDKRGKLGGLWNDPFAQKGTINSPLLTYNGITLGAAPQPGIKVLNFLEEIYQESMTKFQEIPPEIIKGEVTSVKSDSNKPGCYRLETKKEIYEAPIVINAMGLGPPKALNSVLHMSTNTATAQSIRRFQRILDKQDLERLKGKTVVFIGLGNSTAEMIKQFTDFNKEQVYSDEIRFKVLIHKSQEEIENPNANQPERHLSRDPFTKMAFNIVGVFNLKKRHEKYTQTDPEKRPSDKALLNGVKKMLRESSLADYIKDIIKVEKLEDDYPKREDYFKRKLEIAERLNLNFSHFVNPHQIVRYITKGAETVFRSPSQGNLVSYQGDLGEYYRLYKIQIKPNIISDVAHWDLIKAEDGKKAIRVYRYPNDSIPKMKDIEYDQIYALIGYGTEEEKLNEMGISQDKNHYPKLDSDGEVINKDKEVSLGYFLIGYPSANREQKNNITMAGIMNQIYSSSFGAVLRAIEYQLKDSSV